ncbi:hypothetical protein KUV65_17190 [Maritalea mobilis]|uniref:hypothetical protein n=1 Tax=Maritalea mobilis TaxID=483324 RepID=UPI001C98E0D7|nr:hypothetical protein [Maritalea mobilis]MBY6203109.1 hypothetical protein [Maritalea mobilis]
MARPVLTLPPEEATALRAAYESAQTILEYGSGGSTVMASEMQGKKVWSVESDRSWADNLRAYLRTNPPATGTDIVVHHADIGPTKQWGHPVDDTHWQKFAEYPLGVWTLPDFESPCVVLVDGRFRVGCALATAFHTNTPVDLYFDDYFDRPQYRIVEEFLGEPEKIGRMARFWVESMPFPSTRLLDVMRLLTNQN